MFSCWWLQGEATPSHRERQTFICISCFFPLCFFFPPVSLLRYNRCFVPWQPQATLRPEFQSSERRSSQTPIRSEKVAVTDDAACSVCYVVTLFFYDGCQNFQGNPVWTRNDDMQNEMGNRKHPPPPTSREQCAPV